MPWELRFSVWKKWWSNIGLGKENSSSIYLKRKKEYVLMRHLILKNNLPSSLSSYLYFSSCYWTQVLLFILKNQWPRSSGWRTTFDQNVGNLGRWWSQCPPKLSPKILLSCEIFLKGKRKVVSVNHWDGGQSHHHRSLGAGLLTSTISVEFLSNPFYINHVFTAFTVSK